MINRDYSTGCVLPAIVLAALGVPGCTKPSTEARDRQARALEAGAAVKHDEKHLDELPVKDGDKAPTDDAAPAKELCCCNSGCEACLLADGKCPCATGGPKCSDACPCAPAKDWRLVKHSGRWWYYHPDKTWSVWDGKAWQKYQPSRQSQQSTSQKKTNWFGRDKAIRPWRNGLFMGADASSLSAGSRYGRI